MINVFITEKSRKSGQKKPPHLIKPFPVQNSKNYSSITSKLTRRLRIRRKPDSHLGEGGRYSGSHSVHPMRRIPRKSIQLTPVRRVVEMIETSFAAANSSSSSSSSVASDVIGMSRQAAVAGFQRRRRRHGRRLAVGVKEAAALVGAE